jgi:DNA replication protein DnaC
LAQFLSYSYLMLDDFSTPKSSEWVNQTFDYAIYHRDARMKPMIITSNMNPEGIKQKYGNRIMSRIKGMCHILEMTGTDKRQAGPTC